MYFSIYKNLPQCWVYACHNERVKIAGRNCKLWDGDIYMWKSYTGGISTEVMNISKQLNIIGGVYKKIKRNIYANKSQAVTFGEREVEVWSIDGRIKAGKIVMKYLSCNFSEGREAYMSQCLKVIYFTFFKKTWLRGKESYQVLWGEKWKELSYVVRFAIYRGATNTIIYCWD